MSELPDFLSPEPPVEAELSDDPLEDDSLDDDPLSDLELLEDEELDDELEELLLLLLSVL